MTPPPSPTRTAQNYGQRPHQRGQGVLPKDPLLHNAGGHSRRAGTSTTAHPNGPQTRRKYNWFEKHTRRGLLTLRAEDPPGGCPPREKRRGWSCFSVSPAKNLGIPKPDAPLSLLTTREFQRSIATPKIKIYHRPTPLKRSTRSKHNAEGRRRVERHGERSSSQTGVKFA